MSRVAPSYDGLLERTRQQGRLIRELEAKLARSRAEEAVRESQARQAFLVRLGDALRSPADPAGVQRDEGRILRSTSAPATSLIGKRYWPTRWCLVDFLAIDW